MTLAPSARAALAVAKPKPMFRPGSRRATKLMPGKIDVNGLYSAVEEKSATEDHRHPVVQAGAQLVRGS